jgi:hypothetical protein
MTCDVCQDTKRIRCVICKPLDVASYIDETPESAYKEFDCPQCVPQVPYRRVRAMKIATAYDATEFGKYQMPIERGMAARFGEYLLREGLIRFTTSGSKDLGVMAEKITVTAHLGVVSRENVVKAGAVPEVATTKPPAIPLKTRNFTERERARLGIGSKAVRWKPPADTVDASSDFADDAFDEPKDAMGNRFSGLDI